MRDILSIVISILVEDMLDIERPSNCPLTEEQPAVEITSPDHKATVLCTISDRNTINQYINTIDNLIVDASHFFIF